MINRTLNIRSLIWSAAAVLYLFSACAKDSSPVGTLVIAVDRTSVARAETWSAEAAAWSETVVGDAMARGIERLVIVGIGPGVADSAKLGEVDLRLQCGGERCEEDKELLLAGVARGVHTLASTPLNIPGTDLVASINTARQLCSDGPCEITAFTDGLDSRVFGQDLRGERAAAIASLTDALDRLQGATVQLIGIGANPRSRVHADLLGHVWREALIEAGAEDVDIARAI